MTTGITNTGAMTESLETMVAAARVVREYKGIMPNLVRREDLDPNTGLTWNEVSIGKVTAGAVSETERLYNPQQITDTNFPLTPTCVGIHMLLTDRMKRRISKKVLGLLGQQAQNAIQRKKDTDGLLVLQSFTQLAGAGVTMSTDYIAAGQAIIAGNAVEPGEPPFYAVLHPYQIRDLAAELTAGIGTYPVPAGDTSTVLKEGFKLPIAGVTVYADGNITIDSSDDAKGGVWAKNGIVLVQGQSPWTKTKDEPDLGGGAESIYLYDEYIYGEALAGGTTSAFGRGLYGDATAPSN